MTNGNRGRLSNYFLLCGFAAVIALGQVRTAVAQDAVADVSRIVVEAEAESDEKVQGPFLPAVQGTRINSGKKTTVLDLDELPKITNNNYRQALALTPGLYLSEETTPLISIGYRGLDPGRVQYTQVLKDGVPIDADQFGYPEAYYTPPLDTVDRIEFYRGGASLMFGPQPGGALNFITHRPRQDRPFAFGTAQTFGSDAYYSTFSYIDGTIDRLGYYAYYNHRETDGFRTSNSYVDLNAAHAKLVLDASTDSRWILTLDFYDEENGEPGGLTFANGPNAVNYNTNRNGASRLYDVFELTRYFASLAWEKDFSAETKMTMTAWGVAYSRFSARQRGGGFGTLPDPAIAISNSTTIEDQRFYTGGFETRLRHDYELWGGTHTVAGGVQLYGTQSPRQDRRGATRDARDGELRADSDRGVFYAPIFVENRFHWGAWSITPGFRLENIWQSVEEHLNVDKTAEGIPLGHEETYDCVPLFGLGVAYEIAKDVELYGNVSESYRPKIFTQSVPTGGTAIIPEDLQESHAWQYELGFRGKPRSWISWDASAFLLDFDDQVGTIAVPGGFSTVANVGRAQHYGVETALELDLIGLIDELHSTKATIVSGKDASPAPAPRSLVKRYGSLSLFGNTTLLNAEFVSGPLAGKTPRFAPDYLVRTGIIYRWQDRLKIALLGTIVDSSFADDANTPERFVPAYAVCDLTFEAKISKNVSVNAGINNLFDEDYYSRITNTGIDPAYGRNYYAGVSLSF